MIVISAFIMLYDILTTAKDHLVDHAFPRRGIKFNS